MDSMFPQKIPKRQDTSEKKKAKQYGAAALLCILAAVIMTAIKWIWGGVTLGGGRDEVPLGFIIFCVRNVIFLSHTRLSHTAGHRARPVQEW